MLWEIGNNYCSNAKTLENSARSFLWRIYGFLYKFMKDFSVESRYCCEGAEKVLSMGDLWVSSMNL